MGYKTQSKEEIRTNIAEQLVPEFAERDDEAIAQALQAGEPIDAAYTVGEAELLTRLWQ